MTRKFILGAAIAVAVNPSITALAGASDYVFEPVSAQVKKGDDVIVSVRLKHKPTGKMVSDAVIAQTRIDMAPEGMAEMSAPLGPVPGCGIREALQRSDPGHDAATRGRPGRH